MFRDIRLHGITENLVEYEAFAVGAGTAKRFFFELDPTGTTETRLFSPGNELVIHPHGISHQGNGGFFCEYMFGVEQPLPDLVKSDVSNRLLMYGTHYNQSQGSLLFSDTTEGFISFDKLFFDGNATCNYCFFVHAPQLGRSLRKQQESLLKVLGKAIKRSTSIGKGADDQLINELYALLADPEAQLFLIKLVNIRHRAYRDLFQELYFASKKIPDDDYLRLTRLADEYNIDRYQQERIRIDVMYKHPENRRIVGEYQQLLVGCYNRGSVNRLENARLTRLKTLSVRNKIPGALFHTLDTLLKLDHHVDEEEETPYLAETRQIMEGLFLVEQRYASTVNSDDIITLLRYKKMAEENRDRRFEAIILDVSKSCDEQIRDGADLSLLEGFSSIITFFDRYDSTSAIISQLAFMETVRVTEEMLRSLAFNRSEFELLKPELFAELFLNDILANDYLGKFGRDKLLILSEGLSEVAGDMGKIPLLKQRLKDIDEDERLYLLLMDVIRDRIRNFYSKFATPEDLDTLKREVSEELRLKRHIAREIPEHLFLDVIATIKKEASYLHSILPKLATNCDTALREEFITSSGLDRFQIEELERDYFERHGLPLEELRRLQRGVEVSDDQFSWD